MMRQDLIKQGKTSMKQIQITPEAHEKLMEVIKENPTSAIRVLERFGGG